MFKKIIFSLICSSFLFPAAFAAGDAWKAKIICVSGKLKSGEAKKASFVPFGNNFDLKTSPESEDFAGCFVADFPAVAAVGVMSPTDMSHCKIQFDGKVNADKTVKVTFKVIEQKGANCTVQDAGNNTPIITYVK